VIKNDTDYDAEKLVNFEKVIESMKEKKEWGKEAIVELFFEMLPDFGHKETGKYLDGRM